MFFTRSRATLVATADELEALAAFAASVETDEPTAPPLDWFDAGLFLLDTSDSNTGARTPPPLDPMARGIIEVLARPLRSVVLERFADGVAELTWVNWDRRGRATMADGVGDGAIAVTATDMNILPALMTQAVQLSVGMPAASGAPITTTAGVIEGLLAGDEQTDLSSLRADPNLVVILASIRNAWRASGSWFGQTTDTSVTVFFAGNEGFWVVDQDSSAPGSSPTPETEVRLLPASATDVSRLLGDVVTGRKAKPGSKPRAAVPEPSPQSTPPVQPV